MQIEKVMVTPELIKKSGLDKSQIVYKLSSTLLGISGMLSQEEMQQVYEFWQRQIDCDFVRESCSLFTDRDFTDDDIAELAKAMRTLATEKNLADYSALELVIEDTINYLPGDDDNQTIEIEGDIIRNLEGKYSLRMRVNGQLVAGISENIDYRSLKKAAKEQSNIDLPILSELQFKRFGQKYYAHFERGMNLK